MTYVYGLNGPVAETDGSGTTSYYLQDGLGSTMQLTDASGNVTDSYAYDAFGAMTSHTGTNVQPFGYAGQQQDVGAEGGLVYLRARAYDPALGRFLTQDPLPLMQRYSYGSNNPADITDPRGLCGLFSCIADAASGVGATADWVWDHGGGCVARSAGQPANIGYCEAAAVLTSPVGDWVANKICPEKSFGYADLNFTGGLGLVATFGVQCTKSQGLHPYEGVGVGGGFATALTVGPHQGVTPGGFCGFGGSLGEGNGVAGQVGVGGLGSHPSGFGEIGGFNLFVAGGHFAATCGAIE